ncbi:MAG: hypothetical protein MK130_01810 [Puniceicoccaceae bacterium]|nr:hypothetical protein [Puniceicoccaceae bacterium]
MIVILMASLSSVHSYEQGSYFVFDIIESAKVTPTIGRIAIPAEALAQVKKKAATAVEIERSELEIDFMETIQPKTSADSAFELDPMAKIETFTKPTRFRTKALDSGSSESVFGE